MYFYPDLIVYDFENNKISADKNHHLLADVPLNGELEKSGNIFIENYVQTCHPFFYNNREPYLLYDCQIQGQDFNAGQTLRNVIYSLSGSTSEEIEYTFNFSTPYKRLHSNGELSVTDNGYTHTWKFDSIESSSVLIWRKYSKPTFWYLVSLGIGIAVVLGGFFITFVVKNIKKKKGMKILNKIANFDKEKK